MMRESVVGTASLHQPGGVAVPIRLHGRSQGEQIDIAPGRRAPSERPLQLADARSADFTTASALPRDLFLAQLYRETRRADRSKAPLSLVNYRMSRIGSSGDVERMLKLLAALCRETDVIGWLGGDEIAVICPDTGEQGARRFMEKVAERSGDIEYCVDSATYPDPLFERDLPPTLTETDSAHWLLRQHRRGSSGGSYTLKRVIDVVGASTALLLLSPVMLLTALAVKLGSRGPVIFSQQRLGQGGVPFRFYKFRSMVVNGDDGIHREFVRRLIQGELDCVNHQSGGDPLYKIKADPRVTWVGRLIRKTSIDELPQLFNVLRGELSLVGPRPPLPYEAENYRSWHLRRVLEVKPGITGLWQVVGRSKVSFDEMVRLDLRYARQCSLMLDLSILARTVLVVLRCDGAK